MRPDGTCPTCGQKLELRRPSRSSADDAEPRDEAEARPGAPWHFKVLLVALVVYLGWRGVQGIDWIAQHL